MFTSYATINYRTQWITAICDPGILDYYSWMYCQAKHVKLMKPMFGSHISIVRGKEEDIEKGWWERRDENEPVMFQYDPERIFLYDTHVWLPVVSQNFKDIRESVGLSPEPVMPFHLTLGKLY